ncbi:putative telomerase activating protein est1 protein [Eutypa lata UCREL1]|uniref:Putative telomerase activating protein est1 protein n=1 Tax=Eutypa lata (strain UCR-EL1) TaxID=1287681 RepID=M7TDC5_EUTLA|nr:putative telomerase activating protein est1 protein [Eutypa lata UCREL1]
METQNPREIARASFSDALKHRKDIVDKVKTLEKERGNVNYTSRFEEIEQVLSQMRLACIQVIFHDFEYADSKKAESILWSAHTYLNTEYRNIVGRLVAQNQVVQKRKLEKLYRDFLKTSQSFYRAYIQRLSGRFYIPELRRAAEGLELEPTETPLRDTSLPQQLLYHFYRSISIDKPHQLGLDNLEREFKGIRNNQNSKRFSPKDPSEALVEWFVRLHAFYYDGEPFSQQQELEEEVIHRLELAMKAEGFIDILIKMVLTNIAAYSVAKTKVAEAWTANASRHCQFVLRFTIRTICVLLRLLKAGLQDDCGHSIDVEAGTGESPLAFGPVLMKFLPLTRLYIAWLYSLRADLVEYRIDIICCGVLLASGPDIPLGLISRIQNGREVELWTYLDENAPQTYVDETGVDCILSKLNLGDSKPLLEVDVPQPSILTQPVLGLGDLTQLPPGALDGAPEEHPRQVEKGKSIDEKSRDPVFDSDLSEDRDMVDMVDKLLGSTDESHPEASRSQVETTYAAATRKAAHESLASALYAQFGTARKNGQGAAQISSPVSREKSVSRTSVAMAGSSPATYVERSGSRLPDSTSGIPGEKTVDQQSPSSTFSQWADQFLNASSPSMGAFGFKQPTSGAWEASGLSNPSGNQNYTSWLGQEAAAATGSSLAFSHPSSLYMGTPGGGQNQAAPPYHVACNGNYYDATTPFGRVPGYNNREDPAHFRNQLRQTPGEVDDSYDRQILASALLDDSGKPRQNAK